MDKVLHEAALERAKRTLIEYITTSIPSGLVITPAMLQNLDVKWLGLVVAAWALTGILATVMSYIWGIKEGLPEVDEDDFDEKAGDEDDD